MFYGFCFNHFFFWTHLKTKQANGLHDNLMFYLESQQQIVIWFLSKLLIATRQAGHVTLVPHLRWLLLLVKFKTNKKKTLYNSRFQGDHVRLWFRFIFRFEFGFGLNWFGLVHSCICFLYRMELATHVDTRVKWRQYSSPEAKNKTVFVCCWNLCLSEDITRMTSIFYSMIY